MESFGPAGSGGKVSMDSKKKLFPVKSVQQPGSRRTGSKKQNKTRIVRTTRQRLSADLSAAAANYFEKDNNPAPPRRSPHVLMAVYQQERLIAGANDRRRLI